MVKTNKNDAFENSFLKLHKIGLHRTHELKRSMKLWNCESLICGLLLVVIGANFCWCCHSIVIVGFLIYNHLKRSICMLNNWTETSCASMRCRLCCCCLVSISFFYFITSICYFVDFWNSVQNVFIFFGVRLVVLILLLYYVMKWHFSIKEIILFVISTNIRKQTDEYVFISN